MSTPDLPPAPAPVPAPAPAPAPVPAKKSNTLVIVLCVIFGLLFLLLASCVGTCIYVGKKAKDYAKDSKKNPQITALSTIAAFTPDIEVVAKDLDAGTIVLKNKKTGEITKLSARDFSADRVSSVIEKIKQGTPVNNVANSESTSNTPESTPAESRSSSSSVEEPTSAAQSAAQQASIKNFPKDFPVYNGGAVKTLEATQNTFAGVASNTHTFSTSDSPEEVAEFYGKKLTADGYTVMASENSSNENGPKLTRIFQKEGLGSTVNIEVEVQSGKTRVQVNQVLLKQK